MTREEALRALDALQSTVAARLSPNGQAIVDRLRRDFDFYQLYAQAGAEFFMKHRTSSVAEASDAYDVFEAEWANLARTMPATLSPGGDA